nr:hypothetical protein [Pseudomonas sp.]
MSELQSTLNQASSAASTGPGASDSTNENTAVYDIRRAVEQVEKAAEYQADYSAARVGEINRQQEILRGALRK